MQWPQWIKDTYHFVRTMGSSSYIAPAYSQPLSANPETRKKQGQEAKRYTGAATEIAKNTETLAVGAGQVGGATIGGLTAGPVGAVMGFEAVEAAYNVKMAFNDEAPVRSPVKTYSPITGDYGTVGNGALTALSYVGADIRGDEHYSKGGSPDDHPKIIEQRRKIAEATGKARLESYAENGLGPDGKPVPKTDAPSTNPLGIIAGIGAVALGIIGAFTGGWIGALVVGIGALAGVGAFMSSKPSDQSSTTPVSTVNSTAQTKPETTPAPALQQSAPAFTPAASKPSNEVRTR